MSAIHIHHKSFLCNTQIFYIVTVKRRSTIHIRKIFFVSTATLVMRIDHNVALCLPCLSCFPVCCRLKMLDTETCKRSLNLEVQDTSEGSHEPSVGGESRFNVRNFIITVQTRTIQAHTL